MKRIFTPVVVCLLAAAGSLQAQDLQAKVRQGIAKGVAYLESKQNKQDGSWVFAQEPALSALVVMALMGSPDRTAHAEPEAAAKGYEFLLKNVKPDGGIYVRGRATYNTSIALTALVIRGRAADDEVIRKARKFLVGLQTGHDEKGKTDTPFDGGYGYGSSKPNEAPHADLSNTQFALESLYLSKKLLEESGKPVDKKDDLDWGAAIQFVSRCQNLPKYNDQAWAGQDQGTIGGFVYEPVDPKADSNNQKKQGGRTAMRCYGSISYAGMMSFIYAGLTPDDPRVKAALKWLSDNYTVDENPGMGAEGLFYYYHTMSKALSVAHISQLDTKDGKAVDWRAALAGKLLSTQGPDGSWTNTASSRWMEGEPVLVTTYTVLALEQIAQAIQD